MIHFINGSHYPFIGPSAEIRVRVVHRLEDGYILAKNGETIREDMSLKDLLVRIFRSRDELDRELYECSKALAVNHTSAVEHFATRYDQMYARLFKSGKAVLPEHTMSSSFESEFERQYRERQREIDRAAMMQRQAMLHPGQFGGSLASADRAIQELTESNRKEREAEEAKQREEEEIYYLLT